MVTQAETKISTFTAAICIVSCFHPMMALAEDIPLSDEAVETLPAYVVVATRTPLGLDRVSPSVDYVSAEEIELWQDRELSQTLGRVAGVSLASSGATGSVASLFVRGTNSDQTAIFLDGRRLNPAFSGQYDLESLTVTSLESVQILKGGASVNFGSSGIGGVIDLRSRNTSAEEGLSGNTKVEVGSNGYRLFGLETAYTEDRLSFSMGGSFLETDNERANDAYERLTILPRFDYKLTDYLNLELVAQYAESEKEIPGPVTSGPTNDYLEAESWLLSPGIRYATDLLSAHLFYSRTLYTGEGIQAGPFYNEITGDEVNLQIDYSAADSLLLSLGSVYRKEEVFRRGLYQNITEQAGFYAQAIWIVSDAVELRGGLRYDEFSDYDGAWTGSLEAIYNFQKYDLSLFAKISSAYAPPSGQDLAYDFNASTQLEPDESNSYEFGVRQSLFDDNVIYSVVYFRNEIKNLVDYDPFTFDAFNINDATTEGFEFSVDCSAVEDWTVSMSYTYLTAVSDSLDDPRTAFSPDPAKNVRLKRRPRHMLQLSAIHQFTESFRAGVQGVGHFDRVDGDPTTFLLVDAEDYFVVRLVADWQINDTWSVFARVENLLDEEYSSAAGYPALGRAGYIGVRFEF